MQARQAKHNHNPHRGEVSLKLANSSYSLVPSFSTLVAIENETKLGLIEMANLMYENRLGLEVISQLLVCAATPPLSDAEAALAIEEIGVAKTHELVATFLVNAITAGQKIEHPTTPGKP